MAKIDEFLADFALDLFRTIGKAEENAIFSPTSINLVLAMCYGGAEGQTKIQMQNRFYGNHSDDEVHTFMDYLINRNFEKTNTENVVLKAANRLYCQRDYEILQTFRDFVEKRYRSDIFPVDFKNEENREKSRTQINDWVSEKTNEKIKNLIGPKDINETTRLILVNALYFKGVWLKEFEKDSTKKTKFYANPSKIIEVDMMKVEGHFNYFEDEQCQVIFLSYRQDGIKMMIILPKEKFGLSDIEKTLTGKTLEKYISSQNNEKVIVEIPKWKIEQSFKLSKALKSLGVNDPFDGDKADFSSITGKRELYISEVLHKAFIEVDERGTEAAAATAALMLSGCGPPSAPPPPPKHFLADHPFMVAIINRSKHSDILFLGHYVAEEK